jgi:hypothetical protein
MEVQSPYQTNSEIDYSLTGTLNQGLGWASSFEESLNSVSPKGQSSESSSDATGSLEQSNEVSLTDSSQNNALSLLENEETQLSKEVRSTPEMEGENQGRPGCKSSTGDIPNTVNLIDKSNVLLDQVTLIKSRFPHRGSAASILDVVSDTPTIEEAMQSLKERANTTDRKLVSVLLFLDSNRTLSAEYISVWNIVVDMFRTVTIYGHQSSSSTLRTRMIRVWINWSIYVSELPSEKVLNGEVFVISRWMKVVKYILAAFAAWAKDSEILPKSPLTLPHNPSMLLDRKFRDWLINAKQMKLDYWYMSLVDSLARGVKKGADRSTDIDCVVNCIETFNLFTTAKEKPIYLDLSVSDMEREIQRSVDEIIYDSQFEPSWNHCPSFSSCTENSLHKGGHVKVVKKFISKYPREAKIVPKYGMAYEPFPDNHFNDTGCSDPVCIKALPTVDEDCQRAIGRIGEMRSVKYAECSFNPENLGTDLDIEELCKLCLSETSEIRPIGLKEALKVRGITTPCALETWLMKPLQKFLAKCLLKHAVFAVTGTPLTHRHLEAVFKYLLQSEEIVSGDYDNATNMMIGSYTRKCIESICDKLQLSENYRAVAIRSLCDCDVHYQYKDADGKSHEMRAPQKEAQPMGKILSFTVLCIINFAVCRKALELDRKSQIPISRFPGLINGDDCCFPIQCFQHWVGCSAMVGLFNSIGKTFQSRKFVEMNSRTFLLSSNRVENGIMFDLKFQEVPFINFGLMKGLVRSSGCENIVDERRDLTEAVSRMGWCHSELIKGFEPFHSELDYLFKHYHNKYLLSPMLHGVPYYIPFWLGGLGLSVGFEPEKLISPVQRQVCSLLLQNFEKFKPKSVCLEKTCMIHKLVDDWETKIAKEIGVRPIDEFSMLETEDGLHNLSIKDENQRVYAQAVEYIWRTMPLKQFFQELSDDFIEVSNKVSIKKLCHNQRIWKSLYGWTQSVDCRELPWYRIWHQKKEKAIALISVDPGRDNFLRALQLNP